MAWVKKYRAIIFIVFALIAWGAIFYIVPADELIQAVGVNNSYLVSFIVSLVAGFSTFTGTTAYATVIEFARGGSNPYLLGPVSGLGIFLSDSMFYYLANRGRSSIESRFKKFFKKLQRLIEKVPNVVVYIGVFLFSAVGPIPNDIILGVLVVSGYQYKKFWPFLLAGDIFFMTLLCFIFNT